MKPRNAQLVMEGDSREKSTVTGACAANALAVAIPCQQVVKSGGALSGYRGA